MSWKRNGSKPYSRNSVPPQDGSSFQNTESQMPGASKGYRDQSSRKTQMQSQLQRSVEASKQMLYGTFENLIASLEEYERREQNQKGISKPLNRSNIRTPDQRRKNFEDVKSNVETQILLFETQSKACPPEVLTALKEELRHRVLGWTAVRSDIPGLHATDGYIAKVYEILARGKTDHNIPTCKNVTEDVMRDSFQAIINGDHDRQKLDSSFKNDPRKKAAAPDTRHSEMFEEGARRISGAYGRPDLNSCLQCDIQKMQSYGPRDIK